MRRDRGDRRRGHAQRSSTTDVTKRYKLGKDNHVHALRGAVGRDRRRRDGRDRGPERLGQVDDDAPHRLPRHARRRRGAHQRPPRRQPARARRSRSVRGTEIGFIFQGFNLIPTMNALDNVALAAEYAGVSRREAARTRRGAARARRPRRAQAPPAERALRRPAAARRDRPRAREPARRSSSATSRPATWTPRRPTRSSRVMREHQPRRPARRSCS